MLPRTKIQYLVGSVFLK